MPATYSFLSNSTFRTILAGAALAAALALALTATPAKAQWPTSCVELNDVVEARLGNSGNVGIYQRVFGDQAEQACRNDHRSDVQSVFAWAVGGSGSGPSAAPSAWPTSCVALNDIVEARLGNSGNVGIYQRVFGEQAEQACRNDHRADVRALFAWAIPPPPPTPIPTPDPPPAPQPASAPIGEVLHVASPLVFHDRTIWLGTSTGGVLRSTNAGASFAQFIDGLPNLTINAIAPSPTLPNDGIVLVATNNGIGRSSDRGVSWTAVAGLPGGRIGGLAASPRYEADRTFYAVVDSGGLFESTDGGANWSPVFVAHANGLPAATYLGLTAVQGRGESIHIFAWTQSGLFVSDDRGKGFRSVIGRNALPRNFRITAVVIHPAWHYDSVIWLGSEVHGLYRSENGGGSFHQVLTNLDDAVGRINVIALSPNVSRDGTIVVGTQKRGVFLSKRSQPLGTVDNIGAPLSWKRQSVNLRIRNVRGIGFSNGYAEDQTIFVAGGTYFAYSGTGAIDWFTYPDPVGPTS
ncbi:MAG: hypothetical protein OXO54_13765 [Chloroflexota bacterium]|nr:hypothetical protein [Chloroflexota bacterium]